MSKIDYNRKNTRERIERALGFAIACFSPTKAQGWSTRTIDKHFGQQQHPLSAYLRSLLLINANPYYSKEQGTCKKYLLNEAGVEFLRAKLAGSEIEYRDFELEYSRDPEVRRKLRESAPRKQFDDFVVNAYVEREFGEELRKLVFNYEDKSNRLWHPIQHLRREFKKPLLAANGLAHQYDIECAAPTLIRQFAMMRRDGEYLELPAIEHYLKNKSEVREQIAQEAEINGTSAKVIINALFAGARIGKGNHFALSHLLDYDQARVVWLQENEFVTQLRSDIKTCWSSIKDKHHERIITDKNGKTRSLAMSSKMKWGVYFELERRVLNAVREYLTQTNNPHFLEHDGWNTKNPIDQEALQAFVYEQTGFMIKMSYECLSDTDTLEGVAGATPAAYEDTSAARASCSSQQQDLETNEQGSIKYSPYTLVYNFPKSLLRNKQPMAQITQKWMRSIKYSPYTLVYNFPKSVIKNSQL